MIVCRAMDDIFKQVEKNMDMLVEKQVCWSACATQEQMKDAKDGKLDLKLGINKSVPKEWIADIKGKDVLCLAGAGGLQAPVLASAGAKVTVIDISKKMLDKDRLIANENCLNIRIEYGNMIDLSRFENDSFDYIMNPASLFYVPDVMPVFTECYRVLRENGCLILAAPNPISYICEFMNDENGGSFYKAVNRMPYISYEHADQGDWVEFGHTMEEYIGGQIACGFVISGYIEDQYDDLTELYFMTKAEKR
jgi:ubiquinone/menaquinone biosynthesis C-methylase UbiE